MNNEQSQIESNTQMQANLLHGLAPLENIIADSPYFTELAKTNKSEALFDSYLYAQTLKASVTPPIVAYYVGIGGGDEPIDILSSFEKLNVDETIGVDLLDRSGYSDENVDLQTPMNFMLHAAAIQEPWHTQVDAMLRRQQELGQDINIIRADKNSAEFTFRGKLRKIFIYQGNVTTFIPATPTPIIYSKNTLGLVSEVPDVVLANAKLIYNEDNQFSQQRVCNKAVEVGLRQVNLSQAAYILDAGRNQITTNFPTTRLFVRY